MIATLEYIVAVFGICVFVLGLGILAGLVTP